MMLNILLQTVE